MIKTTIIMPCRNEEVYISDVVQSVIDSDLDKNTIEFFIVDGCSTDGTQKMIRQYQEEHKWIKLLINENKTVPYALNMGIKQSKGKYIIRIDSHSEYPANYFSELLFWSRKLDADNVGAAIITDTKSKSKKSCSIARVLSDGVGVGNSYFRTGTDKVLEVDTVPFGCFKKEIFSKAGLFDVRLDKSQDIEMNKRIKRCGGKIFLIPTVKSRYFARETYKDLFSKYFKNGKWNIYVAYLTGRITSLSFRNYVPVLFILSVIGFSVLSFFYRPVLFAFLFMLSLYLLLIIIRSIIISGEKTSLPHLVLVFIVLHFSHGLGGLFGILSFWKKKR